MARTVCQDRPIRYTHRFEADSAPGACARVAQERFPLAHSLRPGYEPNDSRYTGMQRVSVPLNRQQLELLDRTIARGVAPDRAALLKLALREHAATLPRPRTSGERK